MHILTPRKHRTVICYGNQQTLLGIVPTEGWMARTVERTFLGICVLYSYQRQSVYHPSTSKKVQQLLMECRFHLQGLKMFFISIIEDMKTHPFSPINCSKICIIKFNGCSYCPARVDQDWYGWFGWDRSSIGQVQH